MSDTFPPDPQPGSTPSPPPGWAPPPSPGAPPAPGSLLPPPPGGAPGSANWGAPGGWAPPPPGYGPGPKPPRPKAVVGGAIVLAGALLIVLGCFLPWVSGGGSSQNGFDNYYCVNDNCISTSEDWDAPYQASDTIELESPGIFGVMGAVVLAAFGLTLLLAGRLPAIAILALIFAGIGVLVASAFFYVASQVVDDLPGLSIGFGVWLQLLGPLVAVAGSIVALAQRGPRPAPGAGWGTGTTPAAGGWNA